MLDSAGIPTRQMQVGKENVAYVKSFTSGVQEVLSRAIVSPCARELTPNVVILSAAKDLLWLFVRVHKAALLKQPGRFRMRFPRIAPRCVARAAELFFVLLRRNHLP